MSSSSIATAQFNPTTALPGEHIVHSRNSGSGPPGDSYKMNDRTASLARHPDGYAGVIPADDLNELVHFAYATCRHKGQVRMQNCARSVLRSLLCPCAWTEDAITQAIEQELVRADASRRPQCRRPRAVVDTMATPRGCSDTGPDAERRERDGQLDQALADTFPASDPVALGCS